MPRVQRPLAGLHPECSALISFINRVFSEIPFEGELHDLNSKIKKNVKDC